jgi:hypothetical protein
MDRINGAGHVNHLFVAEDAETNRPPTEVTEDWLNGVQEELIAIILAAGIVPSTANLSQLLTALRSAGVFHTPDQFDASTKAATMEAVQRALGNKSGVSGTNVGTSLTAADAGKLYNCYGGSYTLNLPQSDSIVAGWAIEILYTGSGTLTISRQGADVIDGVNPSSPQTSITIGFGESIVITYSSGGKFFASGANSANLKQASMFASSLAVAGFQKLPSGRIEVQGIFTASATPGAAVAVTFPLGATNCRNLELTPVSSGTSAVSAWFDTPTGTGFNGHCSVAGATVHYRAILD